MKRHLTAAAFALALVAPTAAFADWEWTSWSMGVSEVVAASNGKLKPVDGREGQRVHGWDLKAQGDLTWNGFDFGAEFFFDPTGKSLKVVRLTLKDPDECMALERVMITQHGAPIDTSRDFGQLKSHVLSWPRIANGDFAGLTSVNAIGDLSPLCFIRYRPPNATNGG